LTGALGKFAGFIPSSAVFALGQVRAARLAPIPNARPKLAPKGLRVEHFAIDGAAGNAAQGHLGRNAASGPTTPYLVVKQAISNGPQTGEVKRARAARLSRRWG